MSALTPAQRQRRYTAHRSGNHQFCDPERGCELDPGQVHKPLPPPRREAAPVPEVQSQPRPARSGRFGPHGQELWDAFADVEMGPGHKALLVEGCRIVDRCDRFERVLSGGKWFFERVNDDEQVEIIIDNVLSEARQYASALKAIIAELEPKPGTAAAPKPSEQPKPGAGIASLVDRIAARKNGAG